MNQFGNSTHSKYVPEPGQKIPCVHKIHGFYAKDAKLLLKSYNVTWYLFTRSKIKGPEKYRFASIVKLYVTLNCNWSVMDHEL